MKITKHINYKKDWEVIWVSNKFVPDKDYEFVINARTSYGLKTQKKCFVCNRKFENKNKVCIGCFEKKGNRLICMNCYKKLLSL